MSNISIETAAGVHGFQERAVPFKSLITVIYSVIFIVGTFGNVLVIVTICRVRKLRNVHNLFITNLAIADLINILWCLSTSVVSLYVSWPYGEFVCKYVFPVSDVVIASTIFTMVQITVCRYRAICFPFSRKPSVRFIVCVVVATWIVSYVCFALPLVATMKLADGYWVKMSCISEGIAFSYSKIYRLFSFSTLFCAPLVIVLFCVLRIRVKLNETMLLATRSFNGEQILERAKKNKRLIYMLIVIFLCFLCCYFPANVMVMDYTFKGPISKWQHAGKIGQFATALLFVNSTMNPIILYVLSTDFRNGFLEQLNIVDRNAKSKPIKRMPSVYRGAKLSVSQLNPLCMIRSNLRVNAIMMGEAVTFQPPESVQYSSESSLGEKDAGDKEIDGHAIFNIQTQY